MLFRSTGWRIMSCDIEAAFLEAGMDVEMFIEPHPAMVWCGFMSEEQRLENAILLKKSMYGNVDAALRWILMKTEYLTSKKVGMTQSRADPCVFFKKNENGKAMLVVAMTVDDCAIAGTPEAVNWLMNKIEEKFKITRGGRIRKHLGIDYKWKTDENKEPYVELWMDRKRDRKSTRLNSSHSQQSRMPSSA